MYQQQYNMQQGFMQQHCPISDRDLATIVLSELKRIAAEYATASLEANNPIIRETFESLLQKTLHDQERLYQVMNQLNMYGTGSSASFNEIRQEQQKQSQNAQKLQQFIQQNLGSQRMSHSNQQLPLGSQQHAGYGSQQNLYGGRQQNQFGSYRQQDPYGGPQYTPYRSQQYNQYGSQQQNQYRNQQPGQQGSIFASSEIHRDNPIMNRENPSSSYKAPSVNMYQSAASASDFNTTGSRQTYSHSTGAASSQQQNINQMNQTQ